MSQPEHYLQTINPVSVTLDIATDNQLTPAISLHGTTAVAITAPGAMDSAAISFEGSIDGGTSFAPVFQGSTQFTITLDANAATYTLDANTFVAFDQIKVKCASAETANRTFVIKPYAV